MAFPSVGLGLRRITVGEREFRWRFKARECGSVLWVYGTSSRRPLRVIFGGFQDSWAIFYLNSDRPTTEMGPAFTRTAIDFGLRAGWVPDTQGPPFDIEWDNEKFRRVD